MRMLAMFFAVLFMTVVLPTPSVFADGKTVFEAKCATCHGKNGAGNETMAKMFKVDPIALDLVDAETAKKTDKELAQAIAEGKGKMPAFKAKLSVGEIDAIVQYLRTLQKK